MKPSKHILKNLFLGSIQQTFTEVKLCSITVFLSTLCFSSSLFFGCSKQVLVEEKIDLTGFWIATGYQCPIGTFHTEKIHITQNGNQITATKITGDPCVPAGSLTFTATLDVNDRKGQVLYRSGSPSKPNCCTSKGDMEIIDNNNFKSSVNGSNESHLFKRI